MRATKLMWAFMFAGGAPGRASRWGGISMVNGVTCDMALSLAKKYGIDWEKTKEPVSNRHGEFDGTDRDLDYVEYIEGTLVLKNGTTFNWLRRAKLAQFAREIPVLLSTVDNDPIFEGSE